MTLYRVNPELRNKIGLTPMRKDDVAKCLLGNLGSIFLAEDTESICERT